MGRGRRGQGQEQPSAGSELVRGHRSRSKLWPLHQVHSLSRSSESVQEKSRHQLPVHTVLLRGLSPRGLALSGHRLPCLAQPIEPLDDPGIALNHRYPIGDALPGPLLHSGRTATGAAPFRASRSSTWPSEGHDVRAGPCQVGHPQSPCLLWIQAAEVKKALKVRRCPGKALTQVRLGALQTRWPARAGGGSGAR